MHTRNKSKFIHNIAVGNKKYFFFMILPHNKHKTYFRAFLFSLPLVPLEYFTLNIFIFLYALNEHVLATNMHSYAL